MSKHNTIKANLVADYFLYKGQQEKRPISNKKLQKLLYYAQAWSLVIRKNKLFNDKIEAWVHGPAIRNVYIEYKKFGFNPIEKKLDLNNIEAVPQDIKKFLDEIWRVYGKKDAGYLEMLTHSEKPWQEAREGLQGSENSKNLISVKSMRDFYTQKLEFAKASKI